MEFYKPSRKDLKESVSTAKRVSALTGSSFLYHWIDCIYCLIRYGCGPSQYLEGGFYKLRGFDRNRTYTKYRSYKLTKIFNDSSFVHICANKVDFNKHFSSFIGRKWIYCKESTKEEILSFIENYQRVIAKPINLTRGEGVYELDRTIPKANLVCSLIGQDILLEELIIQHNQMCFGNKSVNTLRVNTILDSNGEVHIVKTSLRCGVGNSLVDNYCAGGVVYPVNSEYGRVEGPGGNSIKGQAVFIHPCTEFFMIGREIPYWEEVVDLVKKAAIHLPQVRFIGWDVAITQKGPVLVEGNTRPGAQLIEYQGFDKGKYRKMLSYK